MVSNLDTIRKTENADESILGSLDIGRAACPASQVPFRERREPFPTSTSVAVFLYASIVAYIFYVSILF